MPKNTFIDREDFNSDSELMSYLNKVDKNQYMEYIYNINTFLESKEFHKFGSKYFVKNIINTLGCSVCMRKKFLVLPMLQELILQELRH